MYFCPQISDRDQHVSVVMITAYIKCQRAANEYASRITSSFPLLVANKVKSFYGTVNCHLHPILCQCIFTLDVCTYVVTRCNMTKGCYDAMCRPR